LKILFLCNQGENRSKTAAELYSKKYETESAGIYALNPDNSLTDSLMEWCDIIFVMEDKHINFLVNEKPNYYLNKRVINLKIPDIYSYNQPELKKILRYKVNNFIKELEELIS
jgi:predicted protein tyrosine phosphatase